MWGYQLEGRMPMRGRSDANVSTPRERRHDFWGVVLDAPDASVLGQFYAELLGWELKAEPGWARVAPAQGVAYLGFQSSPAYVQPVWPTEHGSQQQMLHLDFEVDDLAAASAHAVELGASLAREQPNPKDLVHLDPARHPFCLYLGD
jgi:predicted enzyme related to lactoylglutathione lyase